MQLDVGFHVRWRRRLHRQRWAVVGGLLWWCQTLEISAFACWLPFTKANLKSQSMEDGCSPLPRTTENARIHGGDYITWVRRLQCESELYKTKHRAGIPEKHTRWKERKKEKALDRYHAETYHWAESVAVVPSPSTPILCCSSGSNQLSSTVAFTLLMYSFIFSRYS